jgi:hypothetical protein
MDQGMVSAENIAWLNATARRYVIGTPRAELRRFAKQIADRADWRQIREDIEVKICRGPDGNETFVLCRSASRSEKEKAMHERFSKRIEEGLHSLSRRIEKSQMPLDRGQLEGQIGRLLERNSRAAARYLISLIEDKSIPAGVKLKWSARPEWDDWANLTEGTYILRSNIHVGPMNNCGRPIFSSAKPKPPFGFRSPTFACVQSGIRKRTAFKRTF